jgi:hypothetical protein
MTNRRRMGSDDLGHVNASCAIGLVSLGLAGVVARDGEFDIVGCGPGRDSFVADATDHVGRGCELVQRQ